MQTDRCRGDRLRPGGPRDQENRPPGNGDRRRHWPWGVQRAIDQLGLTDDQKPAINTIVQAYRQKEEQLRAELLKQMKEALTPQQYEKFAAAMSRPPGPPPQDNREPANPAPRPPAAAAAPVTSEGEVAVTLTGGYETDRVHGQAGSFWIAARHQSVPSEVFRKAFSGVTPAGPGRGGPTADEARKNKAALMSVLGPYGITNDQLDAVSNYYRYSSFNGEMWRMTAPATAIAKIHNGVVTGFTITNAGSGYSSPPKVSIPGMENLKVTVTLNFGTDFKTNGSIKLKLRSAASVEHSSVCQRGLFTAETRRSRRKPCKAENRCVWSANQSSNCNGQKSISGLNSQRSPRLLR